MATLIPNSFTSYELSEAEELEGTIFTSLQLMCLQNLISSYAEEKILNPYDPNAQIEYMQTEADLKAKIELIQYLIATSDASAAILHNQINT